MSKGEAIRFPTTQWTAVAGRVSPEPLVPMRWGRCSAHTSRRCAHLLRDRRLDSDQADILLQGFISDKILEARSDRRGGSRERTISHFPAGGVGPVCEQPTSLSAAAGSLAAGAGIA